MSLRHPIAIAFTGIALSIGAQSPFDQALDLLVGNNLAPKAEALRLESQAEALRGDNQLAGPEVEYTKVWGNNAEIGDKWTLSVSQGFDWPGVYAARREAIRNSETAAQYLREATMLDTRAEGRQLLIDLIHARQTVDMQTELANRVDALEELYRKGAEEGTETRLDYNKTRLERIAVHRELHSSQAQYQAIVSQLSSFASGRDVDRIITLAGTDYPAVPASVATPDMATLTQRDPAYQAALANAETSRSMAKLERRSRLPGFSIGYEHETEIGGGFNGFAIAVTLPSWGRNHKSKAAELEAQAAVWDAEMALTKRQAQMSGDAMRLKALREVIDEYEPVINDKSNLELLTKALNAGQITYLTYIEEVNYFISAHRDYLDALYDYHTILASMMRYE